MVREFIYILDFNSSRVIKTKIAICESQLEGEELIDAVMNRLHLSKDTCSWMISSVDVKMEEIPLEKISAKNYALGLKLRYPGLSVFYHPNPLHKVVVVGLLEGSSNLEINKDLWDLLIRESNELGIQLMDLRSEDQVQNLVEVKEC